MRSIFYLPALCLFTCGVLADQPPTAADDGWSRAIPCRIQDGANPDLFVMTLGEVQTPLADGVFRPQTDEVDLRNGTVISNYYQNVLGVKFYQPLDKSHFPDPPSGWCSWYYYYNRVNEQEVKRNTAWLAENLKDYGAKYVQIDDGWQGAGGREGQRDWTAVNHQHFPDGMAAVADYIKSLGFEPGLWLAPHGQSNPQVVSNHPNVFLLRPDGTTASDTWEGKYLVDPTAPESAAYLKDLFSKLAGWGYDYFKIDGQPIVVDEYAARKQYMKHPSDDAAALYRDTLDDIRSAIGPDRYLLGCWGTPIEGAGIMNGSRTGGDVVLGWGGFQVALRPTMEFYYLHNIVWYSDPDALLVRPPLTLDQARVWTTLEGLTGQALMSSDNLPDLPEDRVELLRRVFPATNIRPLDLFPSERNKHIWDLKINHLGRNYDVVGIFNFDADQASQLLLKWKDLGLPDDKPVHVFDFWNQEYLGDWEQGMAVKVAPTSCRVLTLVPDNGRIQLLSTSRHITQGWVDLTALKQNDAGDTFTGTSQVIKDDAYELRFAFPRGTNFVVKQAVARDGWLKVPVKIYNHQGWAAVRIMSSKTRTVRWQIQFQPADAFHFPPSAPERVWLERSGLDGVNLHWEEQYYLNAGYQVYLNDRLLGYTPDDSFPLRHLEPHTSYVARVKTVGWDGKESARSAEIRFLPAALLPEKLTLTRLDPEHFSGRWRSYEIADVPAAATPSMKGTRCEQSLAAFGDLDVTFNLQGLYQQFVARVGLGDDSGDDASAEFTVIGDGRELWNSGPVTKSAAPEAVNISIAGVNQLDLKAVVNGKEDRRVQVVWDDPMIFGPAR